MADTKCLFNVGSRAEMIEIIPANQGMYSRKVSVNTKKVDELAKHELMGSKDNVLRLLFSVIEHPDTVVHALKQSKYTRSFSGSGGVKSGFEFHVSKKPLVEFHRYTVETPANSQLDIEIVINDDEDSLREIASVNYTLKLTEMVNMQRSASSEKESTLQVGNKVSLGASHKDVSFFSLSLT